MSKTEQKEESPQYNPDLPIGEADIKKVVTENLNLKVHQDHKNVIFMMDKQGHLKGIARSPPLMKKKENIERESLEIKKGKSKTSRKINFRETNSSVQNNQIHTIEESTEQNYLKKSNEHTFDSWEEKEQKKSFSNSGSQVDFQQFESLTKAMDVQNQHFNYTNKVFIQEMMIDDQMIRKNLNEMDMEMKNPKLTGHKSVLENPFDHKSSSQFNQSVMLESKIQMLSNAQNRRRNRKQSNNTKGAKTMEQSLLEGESKGGKSVSQMRQQHPTTNKDQATSIKSSVFAHQEMEINED